MAMVKSVRQLASSLVGRRLVFRLMLKSLMILPHLARSWAISLVELFLGAGHDLNAVVGELLLQLRATTPPSSTRRSSASPSPPNMPEGPTMPNQLWITKIL